MKLKISWQQLKSDPLHALWIAGYVLAGGIAIYLTGMVWANFIGLQGWFVNFAPVPHIVAGGLLIAEGIKRFQGIPVVHTLQLEHIGLLVSIVLSYIVAPSVFFWALRAWIRRRQEGPVGRFPVRIALGFGLGGPIVLAIVVLSIVGPILSSSVFTRMKSAQNIQMNKDAIITDLNTIATDAQLYKIRPATMSGGQGSYLGYKIPSKFLSGVNASYTSTVTPEQVTLKAVSSLDSNNTVTTTIDADGKFLPSGWIYAGDFQ